MPHPLPTSAPIHAEDGDCSMHWTTAKTSTHDTAKA